MVSHIFFVESYFTALWFLSWGGICRQMPPFHLVVGESLQYQSPQTETASLHVGRTSERTMDLGPKTLILFVVGTCPIHGKSILAPPFDIEMRHTMTFLPP